MFEVVTKCNVNRRFKVNNDHRLKCRVITGVSANRTLLLPLAYVSQLKFTHQLNVLLQYTIVRVGR